MLNVIDKKKSSNVMNVFLGLKNTWRAKYFFKYIFTNIQNIFQTKKWCKYILKHFKMPFFVHSEIYLIYILEKNYKYLYIFFELYAMNQ